ncbi:MAG: hypothetical protein ACXAEL_07505, partial [Candidatus Hodarchaeales archaeon]
AVSRSSCWAFLGLRRSSMRGSWTVVNISSCPLEGARPTLKSLQDTPLEMRHLGIPPGGELFCHSGGVSGSGPSVGPTASRKTNR